MSADASLSDSAVLSVTPGPHLVSGSLTTRRMMADVLIALLPVVLASALMFRGAALRQIGLAVVAALAAETLFLALRGRRAPLGDFSALVTGMILGLSIPPLSPWYVPVIGSIMAIGLGKVLFGGLGQNIFNPAMVGRAFVMIAFPAAMGAAAYLLPACTTDSVTTATPLTAWKMSSEPTALRLLFLGITSGSVGETSAFACLLGGLYLCLRRTASWEIPAGAIAAVLAVSGTATLLHPGAPWTVAHHLFSGAFLLGAFFILTDPVSSPLTPRGKFIFGVGYGLLVLLIRRLSGYPE
ncbi:MAG: RnfABCDGE type electron transport complex subunit D, partial [Kiritimatiellia bacterium]|nr:RnfABCDGE type electron transport complex subunit D [Kiritimatiellia bacterium]